MFDRRGTKFANLAWLSDRQPGWLGSYDAVLVQDDDLALTSSELALLFAWRQVLDLWIVQPSMSPHGLVSYRWSMTSPTHRFRFTNFVETGSPLFRRDKLELFLDDFDGSLSGWGIDHWYMNVLGPDEPRRYGVLDEVAVFNPLARGGAREIDRLRSVADRRARWRAARDHRGMVDVEPRVVGALPRGRLGTLVAIVRTALPYAVHFLRRGRADVVRRARRVERTIGYARAKIQRTLA